jgi:hypothetical protein
MCAVPITYYDAIVCHTAPDRGIAPYWRTVADPSAGPLTTPRTRTATAASALINTGLQPPREQLPERISRFARGVRLQCLSRSSIRDQRDQIGL